MDTPLTSSGKPCKLCSAKLSKGSNENCHLHGGSISPKKTPVNFHYLEDLPRPALQQVLLNMEWEELRKVCNHVPKAFRICKEYNFKQMYMAKHTRLIFINPKLVEQRHTHNYSILSFVDANGFKIKIDYSAERTTVDIDFGNNIIYKSWTVLFTDHADSSGYLIFDDTPKTKKTELKKEFFNKIHRPELANKPWKEIQRVIITDLEKALGSKVHPGIFDVFKK